MFIALFAQNAAADCSLDEVVDYSTIPSTCVSSASYCSAQENENDCVFSLLADGTFGTVCSWNDSQCSLRCGYTTRDPCTSGGCTWNSVTDECSAPATPTMAPATDTPTMAPATDTPTMAPTTAAPTKAPTTAAPTPAPTPNVICGDNARNTYRTKCCGVSPTTTLDHNVANSGLAGTATCNDVRLALQADTCTACTSSQDIESANDGSASSPSPPPPP